MEYQPTIGRQVHYRPTEEEQEIIFKNGGNKMPTLAATVTAVWGTGGCINVRVLSDGPPSTDAWKTSINYDETGEKPGHWSWPPRV